MIQLRNRAAAALPHVLPADSHRRKVVIRKMVAPSWALLQGDAVANRPGLPSDSTQEAILEALRDSWSACAAAGVLTDTTGDMDPRDCCHYVASGTGPF